MPQISITPQMLQSKMKLDPQQTQQLQRIVVAGMKVMFAPQTRQMLQQALQGQGPLGQKVGLAVAGLLGLLMKESQNSIPRQLLIPAGMLLTVHACEFLDQSGAKLGDHDVGVAIDAMQHAVMKVGGIDSNKLASLKPDDVKARAQQQQQQPAPGAPPGGAPPVGAPTGAQPPMGA